MPEITVFGLRRFLQSDSKATDEDSGEKADESGEASGNSTSSDPAALPPDDDNTTIKKKQFEAHFPDPFMT